MTKEPTMRKTTCPACGSTSALPRPLPSYRYRESGLDNVYLQGGVTEITCSACGQKHVAIGNEWQLLQVIALGLLTEEQHLTGPEQRFLRSACDLTQAQLAKRLGVRRETVAEREARSTSSLSRGDEFLFRAVVLKAFCEMLRSEEDNYLADPHLETLRKFTASFTTFVKTFAEGFSPRTRRRRLTVRSSRNIWRAENLRRAA
jgi:DNA-binding transcriptional regulator YiaG